MTEITNSLSRLSRLRHGERGGGSRESEEDEEGDREGPVPWRVCEGRTKSLSSTAFHVRKPPFWRALL